MKKNYYLFLLVAILTVSCGGGGGDSSDGRYDYNPNTGNENTTDIVVTGGVQSVGMTYAEVIGYQNYWDITEMNEIDKGGFIGVEYGTSENNLNLRAPYKSSSDRTIYVKIRELEPNTKYYYRTLVGAGNNWVRGSEIGSFTTKPFSVDKSALSSGDITKKSYSLAQLTNAGIKSKELAKESCSWGVALSSNTSHLTNDLASYLNKWPGYWSWDNGNPIDDAVFFEENESPEFSNLFPGTTYYYCAYLSMAGRIVIGDVKEFITDDIQRTGFVDLGLSVKWAACNIGQTMPWIDYFSPNYNEQKGTFMAWADAQDAITRTYGSGARLPTKEEFQELLNYLKGNNDEYDGEAQLGCALVTGANGQKIALPLVEKYWTSTPQFNSENAHHTVSIYSTAPWSGWNISITDKYATNNGTQCLVRAVMDYSGSGGGTTSSLDIEGTYTAYEYFWDNTNKDWYGHGDSNGNFITYNMTINRKYPGSSTVEIKNLWLYGDNMTIEGELNEATGDITIPGGQNIAYHSTYGNIWADPYSGNYITLEYNSEQKNYLSTVIVPRCSEGIFNYFYVNMIPQ